MDTLEQYRKDMEDLGRALAQMALGALKASEITLRMAAAVEASASHDPAAQAVHEAYAQPETKPEPTPPHDHHVGSCWCDGPVTGPYFPAPAKPEAKPCRVSITAGAHTGRRGTVMAAVRGKKLRVHIDETGRTDDVFACDVTPLEGSAPLPVYAPKSKA